MRGRHAPFYAAVAVAALTIPAGFFLWPRLGFEVTAVAFFLVYLALTAWRLPRLSGAYLKTNVQDTDEPALVILAVTVGAVAVSLGSLFVVLNAG